MENKQNSTYRVKTETAKPSVKSIHLEKNPEESDNIEPSENPLPIFDTDKKQIDEIK